MKDVTLLQPVAMLMGIIAKIKEGVPVNVALNGVVIQHRHQPHRHQPHQAQVHIAPQQTIWL